MALQTGTFTTYSQIGIREELADVIYDITPVDVPFVSSVEQETVANTLFEWQIQSLNAVSKTGALDGDDAPQDTSNPTTLVNNRTHIRTRDARVSGTARAMDTAGRADELDYQILMRGQELKRDMEAIACDNNAKVAGNSTTARETAGIVSWIATNTDGAAADPTGDGSDAATDGTQRAFTEDQLKTVLRECFDSGGMPDTIMAGPFNRQILSSFSAGRTNVQKAEDATLHATFDVYESDFGQLRIIPNRFQRARDVLVLQMDMWSLCFLPGRNMETFDIAKTGDSDARQIVVEFGVKAKNEAANGIVRDLTTS